MPKIDKEVVYLEDKASARLNYIKSGSDVADTSSQGVNWLISKPKIKNGSNALASAHGKPIYVNVASSGRHSYVYLKLEVSESLNRGFGKYNLVHILSEREATEEKIRKLAEGFDSLVRNTWRYIFSKEELEDIEGISEDMLKESVRMNALINEFKNNEE